MRRCCHQPAVERRREARRELFAFPPPRVTPKRCCPSPESPFAGSGVCSWVRLSWGLLQPRGEEELRPETCPSQPLVLSAAEVFSRRSGTDPRSAPRRGWRWGRTLRDPTGPCFMAFAPGWDFLCCSKELLFARTANLVQNVYRDTPVLQGGRRIGRFCTTSPHSSQFPVFICCRARRRDG